MKWNLFKLLYLFNLIYSHLLNTSWSLFFTFKSPSIFSGTLCPTMPEILRKSETNCGTHYCVFTKWVDVLTVFSISTSNKRIDWVKYSSKLFLITINTILIIQSCLYIHVNITVYFVVLWSSLDILQFLQLTFDILNPVTWLIHFLKKKDNIQMLKNPNNVYNLSFWNNANCFYICMNMEQFIIINNTLYT